VVGHTASISEVLLRDLVDAIGTSGREHIGHIHIPNLGGSYGELSIPNHDHFMSSTPSYVDLDMI
jgi:hypothetical protein